MYFVSRSLYHALMLCTLYPALRALCPGPFSLYLHSAPCALALSACTCTPLLVPWPFQPVPALRALHLILCTLPIRLSSSYIFLAWPLKYAAPSDDIIFLYNIICRIILADVYTIRHIISYVNIYFKKYVKSNALLSSHIQLPSQRNCLRQFHSSLGTVVLAERTIHICPLPRCQGADLSTGKRHCG